MLLFSSRPQLPRALLIRPLGRSARTPSRAQPRASSCSGRNLWRFNRWCADPMQTCGDNATTQDADLACLAQHADHVVVLPREGSWEILASTDKSLVHALASRYPNGKIHTLSIQGHPEVRPPLARRCVRVGVSLIPCLPHQFTPSIVGKMIDVRSESGLFTPEMTTEARRRCVMPDEGRTTFGRTMWSVILGEI